MNSSEEMLKLLHKIFRKYVVTNEIVKTAGAQIDDIEVKVDDIEKQNYLETATWGLDIFEKELAVSNADVKTEEERKKIIAAKWRGSGILTLKLLQQTVEAFINYNVKVRFTGVIVIDFSEKIGYPHNFEDIHNAIEDIKPAHLGIEYVFRFRTHKEVGLYRHRELKEYTHWQIRAEEIQVYKTNKEINSIHRRLLNERHIDIRNPNKGDV